MNMKLLGTTSMTPAERKMGRFMRAPDGHDGGGDGNNTGGGDVKSDSGASGSESGNNNGGGFDPASFWQEPEPDKDKSPPSGNSADESKPGSGTTLGETLQARITGFEVKDIFTPAILEEMSEGNFEGAHKAMGAMIQNSMAVQMQNTTELLAQFGSALVGKMQSMIEGKFTDSDQKKALYDAIPSARNPKVGPMVERLYDRAIGIAKGDTKAAIEMTKEMMKTLASETSKDTGLNVAPLSGDSEQSGSSPTNWAESLMSPSS
jgi:hypothetical protein